MVGTVSALAMLGVVLAGSGCGQPATETTPPAATAGTDDHDGHEHDDAGNASSVMAKLGDEDRALAEAQKVCIVSDEPLGSMGTPYKVEHNGEVAFLCCEGCLDAFNSDPERYLAKLKEGSNAEAAADEPAGDAPAEEK
jgi:YHS domain-containing protein